MTLAHVPDPWTERAVCATTDPEIFFPHPGQNPAKAVAICRTCPVRVDCLNEALRHGEEHGAWGGTTPQQRARMHVGDTAPVDKRLLRQAERDAQAHELWRGGWPATRIAQEMSVHPETARKMIARAAAVDAATSDLARSVFELRAVGLGDRDIAERLGVSTAAVERRVRKSRAIKGTDPRRPQNTSGRVAGDSTPTGARPEGGGGIGQTKGAVA